MSALVGFEQVAKTGGNWKSPLLSPGVAFGTVRQVEQGAVVARRPLIVGSSRGVGQRGQTGAKPLM
jgi:hypothetical protein